MKRKTIGILSIFAIIVAIVIGAVCISTLNPKTPNPTLLKPGENKYNIGNYNLTKNGIDGFKEIIKKTPNPPKNYTVAYFEANISKSCNVKTFTLSLETYDENGEFCGIAGYTYSDKMLTYSPPMLSNTSLVYKQNKNSELDYLDAQLKKIPLKQQIAVSGLKQYVVSYRPYTQIEAGAPIFDGRSNDKFAVLDTQKYNSGAAGKSDGKTGVVFRLYDGQSIAMGQQYLYVFKPIDPSTAIGNQFSTMECDYYINNGKLKFTRNYGADWIEADITKDELDSTMEFYRNNLSLPPSSLFISTDEKMPIAYFYGGNPILKLSRDNGKTWTDTPFRTATDFDREITKRVIGFVTPEFGYAAIGTDWSMGNGESKECYFTTDGGQKWTAKPLPLSGKSRTLNDMAMVDKKIGAIALDGGDGIYFPLIFVTSDMGTTWKEVKLPFEQLPEKAQFLIDIESFTYSDGVYRLTLGQGNEGTLKATFVAKDLNGAWSFAECKNSTIHTVG